MKNKLSKKILCLIAIAVVFVAGVSAKKAMAYFTTYVLLEGREDLVLGFSKTEIFETVGNKQKNVTIKNIGTAACYVRVKAIAAEKYGEIKATGTGWTSRNGFYEYDTVLNPQDCTTTLSIALNMLDTETEDFNVIVIQECTPVLYDENGNTYAGWSDGDLKDDFMIEKR